MRTRFGFRCGLLLVMGSLVPLAHAADDGPTCPNFTACNAQGTAALRKDRVDEAIALFQQQATYAEATAIDLQQKDSPPPDPYRQAEQAYDNLALAYLHKHEPLRSRAWSRQALSWNPKDRAARFNLAKAEEALRDWHWPATPEGEYIRYGGNGEWSQFIVESAKDGRIQFCFEGINAGTAVNTGELRATVRLDGMRARYTTREYGSPCVITLALRPDQIVLKQKGDEAACGFGNGVVAEGTFLRVSTHASCPPPEGE